MSNRVTRRQALQGAAALAAPFVLVRNSWAQGKTIQMGIWGGVAGEYIRKVVIPPFEQELGCKVLVEEGVTLSQVGRLRATKDDPKYTVMFMDPLGIEICKREGLIASLPKDKMPNLATVYPRFILEDGHGVAFGVTAAALFYNPKAVAAPTSYADIWDAKYKKRLSLIGVRNTPSTFLVIATAAIATGKPFQEAQYLSDAAWPKLKELKANVLNLFESNAAAVFVAQGEADLGAVEYSQYIYPYTAKGASVDMAFPKEGSFAGHNCEVFVKGGPNPDLGAAFMNRMLDPKIQKGMAEVTLAGPTVPGIEFAPDIAKMLPYPLSRVEEMRLFNVDAANINANRSQWIETLNSIFVS
jgi:putative spermidine/putrescine transport system substrate-binding protein